MSDTPRTDDLARGNHVVPTEFAQGLERELNEATQEGLEQARLLGKSGEREADLLGENARLRAKLIGLPMMIRATALSYASGDTSIAAESALLTLADDIERINEAIAAPTHQTPYKPS